ncbi:SNF1-like_6 [Blepharisma stoltei]|uniref:Protein kinase domain-containing protein n=1 Tax=Blepharisma stoltei TaxID=1481888 RepID=A0AAU9J0X5_9CILI|nr:unnamed protein product [Blepharisma stoltei]
MSELENYRILGPLGRGTFGLVKLAEHLETKTKVALKFLKKKTISEKSMISKVKREIKILKKFQHPHVIKLYEVIDTCTTFILVLEYLPRGELYNYLEKKGKLLEDEARIFVEQILSGLEFCHSHRLVHRDIKPENLLLDLNGNIKIADFGLSNAIRDGEFLSTSCGSPNYAAPEVISGNKYCGPEVDIWSTGVVLYALLTGALPFDDTSIPALFTKIKSGKFSIPYHISADARDLLCRMLNPDPVGRITIQQIKGHPWLYTENLLMKKDTKDFAVSYKLLLNQKLCSETAKFDGVKRTSLVKDDTLESSGGDLSTMDSIRGESKELVTLYESPNSWVYGFRTNMDPSKFMVILINSLKESKIEWKIITNFSLDLRYWTQNRSLKMHLIIYKYENSFVLDFKLVKGKVMIFLDCLHRVYQFFNIHTSY